MFQFERIESPHAHVLKEFIFLKRSYMQHEITSLWWAIDTRLPINNITSFSLNTSILRDASIFTQVYAAF